MADGTDNFPTRYLVNRDACVLTSASPTSTGSLSFVLKAKPVSLLQPTARVIAVAPSSPATAWHGAQLREAGVVCCILPRPARHHPGDRGDKAHSGQGESHRLPLLLAMLAAPPLPASQAAQASAPAQVCGTNPTTVTELIHYHSVLVASPSTRRRDTQEKILIDGVPHTTVK